MLRHTSKHPADAEAAAVLERKARGIATSRALAAECAAPSYENGGEDVSAEDVADAKRSVKLHVLVGSDTPGPSLRTMLSGPQDWSFGG